MVIFQDIAKKISNEFEAEGIARFPAFRLGWGQNILFWKEHCQSKKFCTINFQRKEAGTRKKCLCFVNRKLSFFSCNIVDQEAKHATENSADRSGTRPLVCVWCGLVGSLAETGLDHQLIHSLSLLATSTGQSLSTNLCQYCGTQLFQPTCCWRGRDKVLSSTCRSTNLNCVHRSACRPDSLTTADFLC